MTKGWGRGPLVLVGVALGMLLTFGSAGAQAATVQVSDGTLTYTAGVDERNEVTFSGDGSGVTITEAGGVSIDAPGCTPASGGSVTCPGPIERIITSLADEPDSATNDTSLPSRLIGGAGADTLIGGEGNDIISGGGEIDTIDSRGGDDTIGIRGTYTDNVRCGAGNDRVVADDTDEVAADCETVERPEGPPPPPPSEDRTAVGAPVPTEVFPTIAPGACENRMFGTADGETLAGTADGDSIFALGGNDVVTALAGDDCVFGGSGNDILRGSEGNDFLAGESGADRLGGDVGNDGLSGDAGNDRLTGGAGRDRLFGGRGRDRLIGGSGNDVLNGESSNDVLSGGSGSDRLVGGSGNDSIKAGPGRNSVSGGPGKDRINARNGARDRINCGTGRDLVLADRRDRVRNCERVVRRR